MKITCLKSNEVLELIRAGLRPLVLGRYNAAQLAIGICRREDPESAGNRDHPQRSRGKLRERSMEPGTAVRNQGAVRSAQESRSRAATAPGARVLRQWCRGRMVTSS